jgi:signal transduction histidine kinase
MDDDTGERHRRTERVRQLLRVTARLSGVASGAEVAEVVLTEGAIALGAVTGAIWRVDGAELVLAGATGYPDDVRGALAQIALATEPARPPAIAVLERRSIWIESCDGDDADDPVACADPIAATEDGRAGALACVPLVRDREVMGVLLFAFYAARDFDEDDRAFIELLAHHLAQGLERARLYDAERQARRRAEAGRERAAFLAKASSLLAASLDYETTLRNVAMLAVPRMADWCAIEMAVEGGSEQVAVAHVDSAKLALAKELRRRYPPDEERGVAQVIRTGASQLIAELTGDALVAAAHGDPERIRLVRELGLRSWMVVPIRTRDEVLGAITFVGAESGRTYSGEDLEMAEQLGERAGLAIANARLFEAERSARDQLARLQGATAAFASARTLADVGKVTVDLAMTMVGADRVLVWRLADGFDGVASPGAARDGAQQLDLIAYRGVPPQVLASAQRIALGADVVVARVARRREPFFTDASFVPTSEVVAGSAIPLIVQDRLIGVFGLGFHQPRGFDGGERAFLSSIADQCAQALDRVRAYDEAVRAIGVRDDFLSIAGHELRTPLTALHLQLGSLVGLAGGAGPTRKLGERAGKALSQAERLARLVDELLDVSRIAQGRLTLDIEDVDIGELVLETVARLEDEFRRAGSAPHVKVAHPHGRWDRNRLDQVVTNLLSNAVKYGAGHPIEVAVEDHGPSAHLVVRDHGIGIDGDAQARIFERFERAVSSRHYGGLGLGLWISRQIVQAHGGSIAVESEAGAGARFEVMLPKEGPV